MNHSIKKNKLFQDELLSYEQRGCFDMINFNALIMFSKKNGKFFSFLGAKEKKLLAQFALEYYRNFGSLLCSNKLRSSLVLQVLTTKQRKIVCSLLTLFSSQQSSVSLIDAPPGTGKTFLIAAFSLLLRDKLTYTAYSNNLAASMENMLTITSLTTCKMMMNIFKTNFMGTKSLWSSKRHNNNINKQLHELYMTIKAANLQTHQICVVDEYTILSPWQIVSFYLIAQEKQWHIIFIGDKNQLSSIEKTISHSYNNFPIAKILSTKVFTLATIMRQQDVWFAAKIVKLTELLNEPMTWNRFGQRFEIFKMFVSNFFVETCTKGLYIAARHREITKRIMDISEITKDHGARKNYYADDLRNVPCSKFPTYLLLIVGHFYVYTNKANIKELVLLERIESNNIIHIKCGNKILKLGKTALRENFMVPEHIAWLRTVSNSRLSQFPLKFFAHTFHAVQGLTLEDSSHIELNVDSCLFSIYVALSRVRHGHQVKRLYSRDLHSFMVTHFFDDDFFYKVATLNKEVFLKLKNYILSNDRSKNIPEILKKKFTITKNESLFLNNKQRNLKIFKRKFEKTKPETPLMALCESLVANYSVTTSYSFTSSG